MSEDKKPNRLMNHVAENTSIEDAIADIKTTFANSTKVVGWYAHSTEVRGPFNRWLTVSEVPVEYKTSVASRTHDALYATMAMNFAPKIVQAYESAQAEIESLKKSMMKCHECGSESVSLIHDWDAKEQVRLKDWIKRLTRQLKSEKDFRKLENFLSDGLSEENESLTASLESERSKSAELIKELEFIKKINCSCGSEYTNNELETYQCISCQSIAEYKGE